MARVEHELVVDRPVRDVFAFASDPSKVPMWQPAVVWMRQTTAGPYREGSRIAQTRRLAGRRFDIVVECSRYVPDRVLGLRIVSGPVAGEMITRFHAEQEAGTRITLTADVRGAGLLRAVEGVLASAARRELVADLRRLKVCLEAGRG